MYTRLAQMVVHHPVRVIVIWLLAVAAIVVGANAALGPGGMSAVTETQQSDYLPTHYQSVQATEIAGKAFPGSNAATGVLVITRSDGRPLTSADQALALRVGRQTSAARVPGVLAVQVSPAGLSPNRKVQIATVEFTNNDQDPKTWSAVSALRTLATRLTAGTDLRAGYTGDAPIQGDSQNVQTLVTLGMGAAIVLLLLLMFRSPVISILNLLVIVVTGEFGATYALALGAKVFGFTIDSTVTSLLPVVLLGVGTDYIVFLLFRYRERLRMGEDRKTAMVQAVARVGKAVTSSAAVLMASLCAMLLAQLGVFRVLGPALAFAVLVMLATALTLVPAVVVLLGGAAFWPARAWRRRTEARGLPAWAGSAVARHPARTAVAAVLVLGVLALAVTAFKNSFDDQSQVPAGTPSATAQAALQTGYSVGALYPTAIYLTGHTTSAGVNSVVAAVRAQPVVSSVAGVSSGRGAVQIEAYLKGDPFAAASLTAVQDHLVPAVQTAAARAGMRGYVGGSTAVSADVGQAVSGDMKVIFPVAAALVLLILLLTLRGLLAAATLLGSVAVGFLATLGAGVLVFQVLAGQQGLDFQLPVIVFLFVTAMGTDYNILMVTRIREELAAGRTWPDAAGVAVRRTGPSVGAAGIILCGSFAMLTLSSQTSQIGFCVAMGILLSTFIMAWLLVPSLITCLGKASFWPARERTAPAERRALDDVLAQT